MMMKHVFTDVIRGFYLVQVRTQVHRRTCRSVPIYTGYVCSNITIPRQSVRHWGQNTDVASALLGS